MTSKQFVWSLFFSALFFDKSALSDQTTSCTDLQNEITQLKAQVQSLNSKVEFILGKIANEENHKEVIGNARDLAGVHQETSLLITDRLEEVERILTKAPQEIGPQIVFGTATGGLKAFADVAQDIRTVISSNEDLSGVAYDPINDMLYYCSWLSIYRTDRYGTSVEIVLNDNTSQYGGIIGLAVDWIAGNLYAVSRGGYIFVCSTESTGQLNCTTILNSPDGLTGIALSPNDG